MLSHEVNNVILAIRRCYDFGMKEDRLEQYFLLPIVEISQAIENGVNQLSQRNDLN